VAASIRSIRDALDVRLGSLDGKVSNFQRETVALGCRSLAKGDFAPEGGFDSEAPSGANLLCNEVLALLDRLRPNLARDISVRALIELRGSVIDIERIYPALRDGKGGRLAASGRPGDHDHPRLHSVRRGKKAADSLSGRNVVSGSEFNRIGEARRRHRTRAACRGEAPSSRAAPFHRRYRDLEALE